MAPLRPVVYELMRNPQWYRSRTLLYGARSPDAILYLEEVEKWRSSGIDVQITVDRPDATWSGFVGVVPLLIERHAYRASPTARYLICGPEVMMHYSAKSALASGVRPTDIWLSMERSMQCAFGMCGHCQWGSHFVCKHGPVLRYDVAEKFLKVRDL